jgi:hypothetical protein
LVVVVIFFSEAPHKALMKALTILHLVCFFFPLPLSLSSHYAHL